MNRKKGFTLVELLTVIAIIAIISLIAMPIILSQISSGKTKLKDNQVQLLVKGAERYAAQYYNFLKWVEELDSNGEITRYKAEVTLRELNQKGLVDLPVIDPVTDEEFNPDDTYVTLYKDKNNNVTFEFYNLTGVKLIINSKNQIISKLFVYNDTMILTDVYGEDEEGNDIKNEITYTCKYKDSPIECSALASTDKGVGTYEIIYNLRGKTGVRTVEVKH